MLAPLFFPSFDCYFLSLMITPVRYVCDVFILITQTDLPQTSRISRAPSSCVYLRDCELSHRSVGTSVHFLFCQFFYVFNCSIYRLLFRQIVLHLTLNMFTCVIYSLTEERGLFLCDNYLCDKACIYNLPFKTNSL